MPPKLNQLEKNILSNKELEHVKGGQETLETRNCGCACRYANQGGSSYDNNGYANAAANTSSSGLGGNTTHTVIIRTRPV